LLDNDKKEKLFTSGLNLFNDKKFYDAHEYWEELWLEYYLEDKKFIQGLIQMTVGYYHLTTGNIRGARSLLNKSLDKMKMFSPFNRGIDIDQIIELIEISLIMIDKEDVFDWSVIPTIKVVV